MISQELSEQILESFGAEFLQVVTTAGRILLVLSAVIALANCFFGYRLKKVWIALIGFAVGFLLGFTPCALWIPLDAAPLIGLAAGLLVGVLLALVAYRLYRVGMFFWNAILTFGMVSGLFGDRLEWLGALLGVAAGIVVGLLTLRYLRVVCIFSTSVNGGVLAAQKILTFCNVSNAAAALVFGVLLAALGLLTQFHFARRETADPA